MFGFLTSHSKDTTDPLVSARATAVWLKQLPALDVIGRQQHVMRAFDAMRQSRKPVDPARVQAIEFLDSALGADRRQLIKQYVENYETAPKLAERIWQAIYDLTQGFLFAYQAALEEARHAGQQPALEDRWCRCFSRGCCTTTAPTRSCACSASSAGFPPSGWTCIALTCARRSSASIAFRRSSPARGRMRPPGRAEQEYLNVLLIQQLNTGNLSPAAARLGVFAASRMEPQARARGGSALA